MTYLIFETPGLIDLRAFTLHGVSAKPNTPSPIGFFGTGLKLSMAALVRMGCEPILYRGMDRYVFQKSEIDFRGSSFTMLSLRAKERRWRNWRTLELPYSTEYGKNWEPWMIYRELEANTRDEGGRTYLADLPAPREDVTIIAVDLDGVLKAHADRASIFLPEAEEGSGIQVIDRPSEYLYYRGLNVFRLARPSLLTYNFRDEARLTEDRTLKDEFSALWLLGEHVRRSADERFIERVISAPEKSWEHGIVFNENSAPGAAFHRVMMRHPKNVTANVWGYYSRHDERVVEKTYSLLDTHPAPWAVEGSRVVDASGKAIFEAPYGYAGKWDLMAGALLRRINPAEDDEPDSRWGPDEALGALGEERDHASLAEVPDSPGGEPDAA